jgi:hypothetical protein
MIGFTGQFYGDEGYTKKIESAKKHVPKFIKFMQDKGYFQFEVL